MERSESSTSPWSDVTRLILVLLASVSVAGGTVLFMLHYYGGTGLHRAEHVLMEPELLGSLRYTAKDPGAARAMAYVYHRMEFSYPSHQGTWEHHAVSLQQYGNFFGAVAKEVSEDEVTDAVLGQFRRGDLLSLVLYVKPEGRPGVSDARVFQEIQFSREGDYFRVELRVDDVQRRWAYFHVPGITDKAVALLTGAL